MQELAADAPVEADAAGDVVHVGADLLTEVGDLVDEVDRGGQEGVAGILGELGGFQRGEEDRRLYQIERTVESERDLQSPVRSGADDHTVRPPRVVHHRDVEAWTGGAPRWSRTYQDDVITAVAGLQRKNKD